MGTRCFGIPRSSGASGTTELAAPLFGNEGNSGVWGIPSWSSAMTRTKGAAVTSEQSTLGSQPIKGSGWGTNSFPYSRYHGLPRPEINLLVPSTIHAFCFHSLGPRDAPTWPPPDMCGQGIQTPSGYLQASLELRERPASAHGRGQRNCEIQMQRCGVVVGRAGGSVHFSSNNPIA